jgi:hypothetical protein
VILLVAPETSGELSDWHLSRLTALCIYHRSNESRSTLFVLADEEPSEVGGRICPVHEVARNGWYMLFDRQSYVPSPYWRLCPNISRENVTGLREAEERGCLSFGI